MQNHEIPRILIVDDNPANLVSLRLLLESSVQAHIFEATSGNDALGLTVGQEFALILLDVDMPGMDGYEVAETLRRVDSTRSIPILFVTAAYRDDVHRIQGYRSGAVDYIEKPLNEEILLAKVQIFLDLFVARRNLERSNQSLQQEIQERRKAEHALEMVRFAVDHAGEMVFQLNSEGRILYANELACQRLGYALENLLSMTIMDLDACFSPESWRLHWKALKQKKLLFFQSSHRPRDGNLFPVEVSANYIEFEGEIGYWAFVRDISERKNLELRLQDMNQKLERLVEVRTRDLQRSNQDLQQFAYAASHDLQEPLRQITGYVQLLEKRYRNALDEKAEKYIDYITDGVRHMQALITSLLSYSRVGTQGGDFALVDIEEVLTRSLTFLRPAIRDTGATVTSDPLPTIHADATQMVQLFQNLIGNAIKFQDSGPPIIHISAQQRGGEWIFSFRDNGIGIDPKYTERVFIIFQKLNVRSKYQGTGIGLAICKRIVERHNGRIWVESPLEQGSLIRFSIPDVKEKGS
ncbi:MAG: response regulator [Magnetococcales bacterium]|nr:response regulator [Magnetococcales bacterium]